MDEVQQDILLEDCNEACISSGEVTTGEDLYAMLFKISFHKTRRNT